MNDFRERDWIVFRDLGPILIERYWERCVAELKRIMEAGAATNRDLYWNIVEAAKAQREEARDMFDGCGRSAAFFKILRINSNGLFTEKELGQFSNELRASLDDLKRMRGS